MASPIIEQLATNIEEPLARLVAFEPTTFPVLSVYLNTQPDQHGRTPEAMPYLHREFKALARTWSPGSPERHSFDRDVERIIAYATDKIDTAANGVAIFACWGAAEFFEAIQLTTPVSDNRVYACNQPHLYHLAHLDEQYPRYGSASHLRAGDTRCRGRHDKRRTAASVPARSTGDESHANRGNRDVY